MQYSEDVYCDFYEVFETNKYTSVKDKFFIRYSLLTLNNCSAMGSLVEQAGQAFATVASESITKIVDVLGLPPLTQIFAFLAKIFGQLLGTLSGAEIFTPLLILLPTQAFKNFYVAGTVGFFLIINTLGKLLPPLLPVIIILAVLNGGIAGLLGFIFGLLADILSFVP